MAKGEELNEDLLDQLPDKQIATEFYAKYHLKQILGRGISAIVRRCIQIENGKEFAAKIIDLNNDPVENSSGLSTLEATKQEVASLKHVAGHPSIIELVDVFESNQFIILVFELCRHGELYDYLASVVTLTEKKTKYIMKQILEGLAHIHKKNVVHRDLKPENILLDDNYNVKITDFGFAKHLKGDDLIHDLCGTPGYLAPETLHSSMTQGAPGYSFSVDIWACGVIMFTLLVGTPPFWHRKQLYMLRNIMEGKYSFDSPEWREISEGAKDVVAKFLTVNIDDRISISNALAHPYFQSKQIFGQDITPLKHSLRKTGRKFSRIEEIVLKLHECPFDARKKLKWVLLVVHSVVRLNKLRHMVEHRLKKPIDVCALKMCEYWIKKDELKHLYLRQISNKDDDSSETSSQSLKDEDCQISSQTHEICECQTFNQNLNDESNIEKKDDDLRQNNNELSNSMDNEVAQNITYY